MKILLGVHQFFPCYYAGTERYVLNLARQLMTFGHAVHILTYDLNREAKSSVPGCGGMFMREYSYEGIPITAISHKFFPDFSFDMLNSDFSEASRYLLQRESFDLYHCAHPLRIGGSLAAASQMKIPIVLMLTDYWLQCSLGIMLRGDNTQCSGPEGGKKCLKHCFSSKTQKDFALRQKAATELVKYADRILSPSLFLIGVFQYSGFLPAGYVYLSRHGFDYSLIHNITPHKLDRERIVVGYIGTIQYHKGIHVLVDAFRKVSSTRLRLEIWGGCFHETDYDTYIKRIAKADPRIEFRGAYNYNDLQKVMAGIDMVVVPSLWYENAPLTISSSHACGTPVITANIGGMSEMVSNEVDGLTFQAGDADSLAACLRRIDQQPELIEDFRKAITPPVHLEEEAFSMERLYKTLISE